MWKARKPMLLGGAAMLVGFIISRIIIGSGADDVGLLSVLLLLLMWPLDLLYVLLSLANFPPGGLFGAVMLGGSFLWGCTLTALVRFIVFDLMEVGARKRALRKRELESSEE